MPHELDPYEHYIEGESLPWGFTVKEDGSAKDLSNASVEYHIVPGKGDTKSDAVLTDTDTEVTVDVEPSNPTRDDAPQDKTGYIEIRLASDSLQGRGGETLWHRVIVNDGDNPPGQRKFRGEFEIQEE